MDQSVRIEDYPQPFSQIATRSLGHNRPTLLIPHQLDATTPAPTDRRARRMLIEATIADAVDLFNVDALWAAVSLRIDMDL